MATIKYHLLSIDKIELRVEAKGIEHRAKSIEHITDAVNAGILRIGEWEKR